MQRHCDPDVLALAAVDASELTTADQAHLALCAQCTAELASFRSVVATGKASADVVLMDPPASVWRAIDAAVSSETAPVATVTDLNQQRSRSKQNRATSPLSRWLPVGVAAGIGLLLGALVTGAITTGQEPGPADVQIVAEAQLAALPDGPVETVGTGTAMFEKDPSGNDILVVDTRDLEQPSGFYQVWLIDPKTMGMVSLGTIGSGAQTVTFPVPAGIDPKVFSLVDISDEPIDGDPTHSKVSILRGELAT